MAIDLLPALIPLVSRVRQDITWRRVGKSQRCERKTPLGKSVLRVHLKGGEQRGVCPIKEGENTTRVAVLDLDSHKGESSWDEMLFVCQEVCEHFEAAGYFPVPFRSTGGRGVHLYFIWDAPQDCYSLRRHFASLIGDCGFTDGCKGISRREIEIFPKQDLVPKGGCGNQFILPLSGESVPLEPLLGYENMPREHALKINWQSNPDVPVSEKPVADKAQKTTHFEGGEGELQRMLAAIPNGEANYDLWIKIGMALHAESGGDEDGLALWQEWSQRCPDYGGYEELLYKWNSFRDDKDKIVTAGSIKKLAAQHGYQEDYSLDFTDVPAELPPELPVAAEKKDARFKPIRADKFIGRKPPKWLIKGVLPEKSTGMTFGGSGDGKTFAILDMACAIALGLPWQGRKVKRGHVVYICAEGAGGFTTRLQAYAAHHKIDMKDLGDYFTVIPASPNFMQKKDVEELIAEINSYNKRTDLIIIDTMAQTTTGADENSAKDMNIALKYLEALRSKTNSAAHIIHHAGKNEDRGARGSSTLKAALDVQFQVSRDGDARLFWVLKMKDGLDGFGWKFNLLTQELTPDEDGDMVTSCYVNFDDKMLDDKPPRRREHTPTENYILAAWEALGGATVSVNDVIEEAVPSIPHVDGTSDVRRKILSGALRDLAAAGEILVRDGQLVNDLTA